jgi:biphenyl 2,3-dioxygenase subunit beta
MAVHTSVTDAIALQYQVEQFLYAEARLLDSWAWAQWLELFTDDVRYWMPVRKNRLRRERTNDDRPAGIEMALFDDDRNQLGVRVQQLASGRHWAEDPPSRCRHLITNVSVSPSANAGELDVQSNFIVYRNRLETEVDIWAGERADVLRPDGDSFKIAKRTILLDQNVILSKNLSVFF